ncbi:MAG TPA: hypothetical protein VN132_15530 [Bdellovibrio sp.]|nr:hypothetical protein [Bdellovibrio sp.]
MHKDILVQMVTTQLKETVNMREKTSEFIRRIVDLYTLQLMQQGHIPANYFAEITSDIETEVIEIFRKKTYGYLTLEEYRRHSCRQKDDT